MDTDVGTCQVTLAFSTHRPETIPFAASYMQRHDAIILEEPPSPYFTSMLEGRHSIDEYILWTDFEFPSFARQICRQLRDLHKDRKVILQVDPYMEILGRVHDFFADGGSPEGISKDSSEKVVYEAERAWTGALLHFYKQSVRASFEDVVEAVQEFARIDAARGRLRDRLRAEMLAKIVPDFHSTYVEAGYIHFYLQRELRRRLPATCTLTPIYLMEPVIRPLLDRRQVLGPGDLLTLLYTYRPSYQGVTATLLAAKSLIYIKILEKGEIPTSDGPFPHTRNEIDSARLIADLSFEDCRRLYAKIRWKKTAEAREIVRNCSKPGTP
ncbi:MAG: hypothetical protein JRF02_02830 [Deltaproteobacteria bacterium]|jgi:hypothetical protein|nr:hypothetical protein [Deltaproteobacteria bacterium]